MINDRKEIICHGRTGKGGTGTRLWVEQQTLMASNKTEDLAADLLEKVCLRANLNRAYKHVKSNKGSPGIDGMTIEELVGWIRGNKERLIEDLSIGY